MKKIVILTGSELRHTFIRKAIALDSNIEVLKSYCEGNEQSLKTQTLQEKNAESLEVKHLNARSRSENDFFEIFVSLTPEESNPITIRKGEINDDEIVMEIIQMSPDLIIAYGCSIIKEPLLKAFGGRFVNIHLGLSPYYRGSGTNFWPLVNDEVDCVGVTFMHIDAGIDTGEIIHQVRARVFEGDTPHQIGNRLIGDIAQVIRNLIVRFDDLVKMEQLPTPKDAKLYRNSDFSKESVQKLYKNFDAGIVQKYLLKKETTKVEIIENPVLRVLD